MNTQVLVTALELAAKYGVPAVLDIVRTWSKDTVTLEDVQQLESLVQPANDYFKG